MGIPLMLLGMRRIFSLARALLQNLGGDMRAGMMGLAVFSMLWSAGCLWSPEISERVVVERAPVLDRSRVSPPPDGAGQSVVQMTGLTTFSVDGAVSDPDDDPEMLKYLWFLDYPDAAGPAIMSGLGGFKTVSINPCSRLYQDILTPGSTHLLELIVTDGTVEYDPVLGRTIQGGYVYVVWWVEVNASCPTS